MWHNTGRATGPFLSDASGWLEPDWRHTENSDTKRRFRNLLDVSGLLDQLTRIDPRPATVEELCRFHTPEYVERIRELSAGAGGEGDDGTTVIGKGSYEVALLAAGGVDRRRRRGPRRPGGQRLCARPPAGAPCAARRARWASACSATSRRRPPRAGGAAWSASPSSTGTCTTATARRPRSTTTRSVLTISIHQDNCFPPGSGAIGRHRRGRRRRLQHQRAAAAGLRRRRVRGDVRADRRPGARAVPPAAHHRPLGPGRLRDGSARADDGVARRLRADGADHGRRRRAPVRRPAGPRARGRLLGRAGPLLRACDHGGAVRHRDRGARHDPAALPANMGQQELQPHQEALIDRVAALVPAIS